jgi:hypothetical protein
VTEERPDIESLRRNPVGHSERDFERILVYNGFEFVRQARHGAMYRHPELALHPDLTIRRDKAWVLIPNGCENKRYVARDVVAAIELVERIRKEKTGG